MKRLICVLSLFAISLIYAMPAQAFGNGGFGFFRQRQQRVDVNVQVQAAAPVVVERQVIRQVPVYQQQVIRQQVFQAAPVYGVVRQQQLFAPVQPYTSFGVGVYNQNFGAGCGNAFGAGSYQSFQSFRGAGCGY